MNNLGRNLGITEKEIRHMNSFLKGLLRRTRSRWEDNIKMDIKEIGIKNWNWAYWLRIGITGESL
jgi:hypothetical protein